MAEQAASQNLKNLRILWHSNALWSKVGYGQQSNLFVKRLHKAGYPIAVSSFYGLEGSMLTLEGIPVYPRGLHPYGMDIAAAHATHFKADILMTLMDAWVCESSMYTRSRWVPWFPVDSYPLPKAVFAKVQHAYKRIVFSKFGKQMVEDAGLDCEYVPHGVDTNIFKPLKVNARKETGFRDDVFLVGMVAANKGNPSRKAFQQNLDAFKLLADKHDDVMMYLHTSQGEAGQYQGFNIPEYARYLGIEDKIIFCDQYQQMLGFPEEWMNLLYNSFDVHLLASMGEGFGIPILEAQAAGCPVIVGNWTAMPELCFSGWKVTEAQKVWTPLAAYQYSPEPYNIYEQLETAYRMRGNQDYRDRARKGAMAYDADRLVEKYWVPVLDGIYEGMKAPAIEVMNDIQFVE